MSAARSVASTRRASRKKTGASSVPASAGARRQAQGAYPKSATPTAIRSFAVGGWTHSVGGSPRRYCSAVFAWYTSSKYSSPGVPRPGKRKRAAARAITPRRTSVRRGSAGRRSRKRSSTGNAQRPTTKSLTPGAPIRRETGASASIAQLEEPMRTKTSTRGSLNAGERRISSGSVGRVVAAGGAHRHDRFLAGLEGLAPGADLLLDRAPRLVLVRGGEARAGLDRADGAGAHVLQPETHGGGDEVLPLLRRVHDPERLDSADRELLRRVVSLAGDGEEGKGAEHGADAGDA